MAFRARDAVTPANTVCSGLLKKGNILQMEKWYDITDLIAVIDQLRLDGFVIISPELLFERLDTRRLTMRESDNGTKQVRIPGCACYAHQWGWHAKTCPLYNDALVP